MDTCCFRLACRVVLFVSMSQIAWAPSAAQQHEAWIGAHASTEGLQIEAGRDFGPKLGARLFAAAYEVDRDFTAGRVDYVGTLDLQSFGALLDYSPTAKSFHFTAGLVVSQHEAFGTAAVLDIARSELGTELVEEAIRLLGSDFDFGTLEGRADYSSVVPYVGLGWRTAGDRGGLGFSFDLGVAFLGEPDVTLGFNSSLPLDLVPGAREIVDAFLLEQQRLIEDELDGYKTFPIARIGVIYRL